MFTDSFTDNYAYRNLLDLKSEKLNLKEMFVNDPNRANEFSVSTEYLFLDYSRQLVNSKIMKQLIGLTQGMSLKEKIEAMFSGEKVNLSEDRAAGHTALRNISNKPVVINGRDVMQDVNQVLRKIKKFSHEIHSGKRTGYTGKMIKNVVVESIGGSYLGTSFIAETCKPYALNKINLIFVANVDGADFYEKTKDLNPEETLFIVISKTFTTVEVMKNAKSAKNWMKMHLGNDRQVIKKHFVAITADPKKAKEFGINNIFEFWDWVGGRYSVTSAVGALPLSLYLGYEKFYSILEGAHWMDKHFLNTPFEKNIPVIAALIDIWNINYKGFLSKYVEPYSESLWKQTEHLQQLSMESLGKSALNNGKPVRFHTGEVIFGVAGTKGQHSTGQLKFQGTQIIPTDYLGFLTPCDEYDRNWLSHEDVTHHEELMINLFAQADAAAFGEKNKDLSRNFDGNRPSSIFLLKKLTPYTMGIILAMMEHITVAKGFIWGINPFDQFGVENAKKEGGKIRSQIIKKNINNNHVIDCGCLSTNRIVSALIDGELPK